MKLPERPASIGNLDPFPVRVLYFGEYDFLNSQAIRIERQPAQSADDTARALDDINRSWRLIIDPVTELPFETASVNPTAEFTILHSSTYTSSLLTNVGNAAQLARAGDYMHNTHRVYVASPGNGGSVYFDQKERQYIRKYGRYTWSDDGRIVALPTIQALSRALRHANIEPAALTADSAGTTTNRALAAHLPPGSIRYIYEKGTPGIRDHNWLHLAAHMLIVENVLHSRTHRSTTRDPDAITPQLLAETQQALPNIYASNTRATSRASVRAVRQVHQIAKLLTDAQGFGRGLHTGDPLINDTLIALQHQPEAMITYHCATHDPFIAGHVPAAIVSYLMRLDYLTRMNGTGRTKVNAVIVPGSHNDHAYYPALRRSVEHWAFTRPAS
jgi:hypothetical protein